MTSRSNPETTDTPLSDFESALECLILESFAEGVPIQGAWDVTSSSSVVPNWQVTIEKLGEADLPQDDPTFLDE